MRISLMLCAAWIWAAAPTVVAQPVVAAIPAQPLADALAEFAEHTGLQVVYVSDIIGKRRSQDVPAGLEPGVALTRMLDGTGLRFDFLNARTIRIIAGSTGTRSTTRQGSPAIEAGKDGDLAGSSTRLDEVLVTATRRTEDAGTVPISMMVWSEEAMVESGVKGMPELGALTPGVGFDWRANLGAGIYTIIEMRGISGRHGVSTGIFIDDTPLPPEWLDTYGRTFPSVFDLERVEVLRGPQGTLLGQGTLGGAIRFIPKQPSLADFSSGAVVELGTTDHGDFTYEAGAAAGGPVKDDVLGLRASAWYRSAGGFVDRIDPFTGAIVDRNADRTTAGSARVAGTWNLGESVRVMPSLHFESYRIDDTSAFYRHLSEPEEGKFRSSSLLRQPAEDRFTLATVKVTANLRETDLVAVSSMLDRATASTHDFTCLGGCDNPLGLDYPASYADAIALAINIEQTMFAQELRLLRSGDADFTWLIGAFYAQTDTQDWLGDSQAPRSEHGTVEIEQEQLEGFVQFTRRWGERYAASAGWRVGRADYGYFTAPYVVRGGSDDTTDAPRFDLSYRSDQGSFYYLTAAKGYRSGGLAPCGTWEFPPDDVWSYEVGVKTDILGDRAHLDAGLFHARWSNDQADPAVVGCGFAFQRGKAASNGVELTGAARLNDRVNLDLALTYTDARYTQSVEMDGQLIVRDGDAVQGARPPLNVTAAIDYRIPIASDTTLTMRLEDIYRGGTTARSIEENPASPFYSPDSVRYQNTNLLNLRVTLRQPRSEFALFVTNALNAHPILASTPNCGCMRENAIHEAYTLTPRTIGVSATWRP